MLTIRMNCALRRCVSKLHASVHAQKRAKCARVLLCFQENDVAKAPVGTEVVFSCWRASVLARSWCGGGGDGGSHWPGFPKRRRGEKYACAARGTRICRGRMAGQNRGPRYLPGHKYRL